MAGAKQEKNKSADYGDVKRALTQSGPRRLYLIYGQEDFLREQLCREIKTVCAGEGEDGWNHRRLDGEGLDVRALEEAVGVPPFMGERTLAEVRALPLNSLKEEQINGLKAVFSDIPDWCTLLITLPSGYEPDGRLAVFKAIKKYGEVIEFSRQGQPQLINWITRRFAALGARVSRESAELLVFMTGGLMSRLAGEIDKLAAYVKDGEVKPDDIAEVCVKIPEARVFELTELLSQRRFSEAAAVLEELLNQREEPIMLLALLGRTARQLYSARLIIKDGGGQRELMAQLDIKYDFIAKRLLDAARGFSRKTLAELLERAARADFELKGHRSQQGREVLTELLIFLALAGGDGAA